MTTTLLFLALFFDLYLPPYLMYIDVVQNPKRVEISKNEAWNRVKGGPHATTRIAHHHKKQTRKSYPGKP